MGVICYLHDVTQQTQHNAGYILQLQSKQISLTNLQLSSAQSVSLAQSACNIHIHLFGQMPMFLA